MQGSTIKLVFLLEHLLGCCFILKKKFFNKVHTFKYLRTRVSETMIYEK